MPVMRAHRELALAIVLTTSASANADPHRAEELEQLRISTAYVIEAGELEANLIPSYFDYRDGWHRSIEAELEYAVSERFMVEVEVPYHWRSFDDAEDVDGTGNVELGAKWLLSDRGDFAVGLDLGVELPAGSEREEIADDIWGAEVSMPLSIRYPASHMALHIEPGLEWEEHEGFEEQFLNVALERRAANSNVTLQLGSNISHQEDDLIAYLVPAFEVAASTVPFQFGMGLAVGVTSESADWGVVCDFEVEF